MTKLYGVRPGRDASRLDQLLYLRRVGYLTNLPWLIICLVVIGIALPSPFDWLLPVVLAPPWLFGFALINVQIRRARRASGG